MCALGADRWVEGTLGRGKEGRGCAVLLPRRRLGCRRGADEIADGERGGEIVMEPRAARMVGGSLYGSKPWQTMTLLRI